MKKGKETLDTAQSRLAYVRKLEGLDQKEIYNTNPPRNGAERVSNIETGKNKIKLPYLLIWGEKGYNIHWIITGVGPIKVTESSPQIDLSSMLDVINQSKLTKSEKNFLIESISKLQERVYKTTEELMRKTEEIDDIKQRARSLKSSK